MVSKTRGSLLSRTFQQTSKQINVIALKMTHIMKTATQANVLECGGRTGC